MQDSPPRLHENVVGKTASEWSVNWWRERHRQGYFPMMEEHLDWKVQEGLPDHFNLLQTAYDSVVLEIGCGYGEWLVPVSRVVGMVVGVDVHKSLDDVAAQKFEERDIRNAWFVLTDGLSLPFRDEYFDAVFSVSVFQHVPRATVRRYFEESDRVLKSGGRALFHFRRADGVGEYSGDIVIDHPGDFSVGWADGEALAEGSRVGWSCREIEAGQFLYLFGEKT